MTQKEKIGERMMKFRIIKDGWWYLAQFLSNGDWSTFNLYFTKWGAKQGCRAYAKHIKQGKKVIEEFEL